jgi:hypothetical protein
MRVLDNIEKLAVINLVLESSGAYMGEVSRGPMREFGYPEYFELHDEADASHVAMATEPLRQQPTETLGRLMVVVDRSWRMMSAYVERVGSLVLGDERAAASMLEAR